MTDLKKFIFFGPIFIKYKEELKGCMLLESKNGMGSIELKEKKLDFIIFCSNIMKALVNEKEIYLSTFKTGELL